MAEVLSGRKATYYATATEEGTGPVYLRVLARNGEQKVYATPMRDQRYETGDVFYLSSLVNEIARLTAYPDWRIKAKGIGTIARHG